MKVVAATAECMSTLLNCHTSPLKKGATVLHLPMCISLLFHPGVNDPLLELKHKSR